MFVAINNADKNAIKIEGMIQRTRNNGEITPEFAMEILSLTNHRSNIKKLVSSIKDKCVTKKDILPYKEFVLSCVDRREVEGEAFDNLREMAKVCDCEKEFDKANKKQKLYNKFDCEVVTIKSIEEFKRLRGENLTVYFDADKVDFKSCDLSKVKDIKFREGAEVYLGHATNLPKCLDVSMCSWVNLEYCDLEGLKLKFREGAEVNISNSKNLPKDLDVSMCSKLWLCDCNLEGLNLKFREGAEVDLMSAQYLPKDLDVSMCSYVELKFCYLEGLNLKFREGAEVSLDRAHNLSKDLDFSMCSKVDLSWCDLEGLNLKFKEGAAVYLGCAKNLPKDLDVSMCSKVDLRCCDLEGLNLKFKEGAVVYLGSAKNLPKELDVSMCSKVDLYKCDLSSVKQIKFRNMMQYEESCMGKENFCGEVVYASIFSRISKRLGSGGMGE